MRYGSSYTEIRTLPPGFGIGHHRRFPHPLKTHGREHPGDAITQGSAG